ncbi:hypothetical protein BC829DRAFT_200309 [Chytridium lagenaria]|nr:hypothetical protein BC829DRAFT_200309 [Chytridium lagenaria]
MSKIAALPSELQICRECALLGNYDMALVYFDTIIQTITLHMKTLQSSEEKVKWSEVKKDLLEEFQVVRGISTELAGFKDKSPREHNFSREKPSGDPASHSHERDRDVWPAPTPQPRRTFAPPPRRSTHRSSDDDASLPSWAKGQPANIVNNHSKQPAKTQKTLTKSKATAR